VPIIDRNFPSDRLREERKHSSKVLVLAMILVAMLILGAIAGLIGHMGNSKEPLSSETPVRIPARMAYTVHSPISINGNGGFTNESGVVWGSGKELDPYIIEGWDISSPDVDGIEILNCDAHFIVKDCRLVAAGAWPNYPDGIYLENCGNGRLMNNSCTDYQLAIGIRSSVGITVIGNNGSSSMYGAWVYQSNSILMMNNTFSDNDYLGLAIQSTDNSVLVNNTCSSNADNGTWVYGCDNTTLINNECNWNFRDGITISSSENSTLTNNRCSNNTVGCGIFLFISNNNSLVGNICDRNGEGLSLFIASDNRVTDNNFSHSVHDGISVRFTSYRNTVNGNSIFQNSEFGIFLDSWSTDIPMYNRFWNNSLLSNNGAGTSYDPAHAQANDLGIDNQWNGTDGRGNYWSDWTIPDVAPPDGIVDVPYEIAGSAGAKDYYPLTTPHAPIPEFGMTPLVVVVLLIVIVLAGETRRKKRPWP
jgi:parallel beta-helix repeat protein